MGGIASPPVDMQAPETLGWVFTVFFVMQIVPAAGYYVLRSVREPVPFLALLGGLGAALGEAMLDALTLLWWPTNIPLTAFTAFDVEVPAYALMGYCLFLGAGCYWVYEQIRDGKGARAVWVAAAVFFVADLVYEPPFISMGLYEYYGPQPMEVAGFPLYWGFLNTMVVIVGGWLFFLFEDRMVGAGRLIALVIPMFALGPLIGAAWPTFLTLHMDVPELARWTAAAYSIWLSVWAVRYVAEVAEARRVTAHLAREERGARSEPAAVALPVEGARPTAVG